jgi:hypothetical protein
VALAGLLQVGGLAQDMSEIISLRSEVDSLRREVSGGMSAGYDDPKPVPATAAEGSGCGCGQGCCGQACCHGCGCNSCCQSCCDCCNTGCCQTGGTCGCFEPCCHCPGLWVSAELMWFRYHRADGVRVGVGAGDDEEFDFEPTLRLTAGWVGEDGLGARLRYWEFDHNSNGDGDADRLFVDTYTFDFEVFDTFCLNRNWDLELAAGIRYNEFEERMLDIGAPDVARLNAFSGIGVISSAEVRRLVGTSGALFARARGAILMDDKDIFNGQGPQQEQLLDVVVGVTELAFGYDYVSPLCDRSYTFVRLQAEWQTWYNYSSSFVDTAADENFGGPSDVGFGGFGVAVGWIR